MRPKAVLAVLAIAVAGAGAGIALERHYLGTAAADTAPAGQEAKILYWWDPMMPEFKSDKPGKSPMGMDMVPVYESEEAGEAGTVAVSPAMLQSLGVRTATAETGTLSPVIDTFGTVAFDDSRIAHIHVRARGWVEVLHARVEGEAVRKGDPLFEFFSPDLASAAYEFVRELERGADAEGARRKLAALGVSARQVEEIRKSRKVPDRIQVYAPQDGVVTDLALADGMFVEPDMTLMTLTDLSSVWVLAEVFESQAALVRHGMDAVVTVKGMEGEPLAGTVDYIYPDLRPDTRTVRLRLRLANPDGDLRPNMYAAVRLTPQGGETSILVPREAVIRTGAGDRVVLAEGEGRFKPVPVTTGRTAEGRTEVLDGLSPGDLIVTSSQFLFDSEANLSGALAKLTEPAGEVPAATPAEGTVEAVKDDALTISHGPIEALGWPAMTMDFAVDPGALPQGLAEGDAIGFQAVKAPDGMYRAQQVTRAGDAAATAGTEADAWADAQVEEAPADGMVLLTHDPIAAIGWPEMTMGFAYVPDLEPMLVPGTRLRIGLAKQPDGSYRIIAAQPPGGGA